MQKKELLLKNVNNKESYPKIHFSDEKMIICPVCWNKFKESFFVGGICGNCFKND